MSHFEFDGSQYEKASAHQTQWGQELISFLSLSGTESILDLGCGDGRLTQQLAQLVPHGSVLGIDASAGMIQTAKQREESNLSFQQMDINAMNFREEFDVIFSNAALHWILDHRRLLRAAYCALKPNGKLLWNFAGDGNCSHFFAVVRQLMDQLPYRSYFASFSWPWYMPTLEEYRALAEQAGFSEIQVKEVNADRYFPDPDSLIRWIDQPSLVPFLQPLPEDLKSSFREETVQQMVRRTIQPDGRCFETFRRIQVQAKK